MPLDIKDLVTSRLGENYELHDRHLNRTLVKVQRTIGFDIVYARAEGSYLYDMDGKDYLDFLSGFGVYNIGRNHPVAKKAIRDILDLDLPNMVQLDSALMSGLLAERLVQRLAQQGAPHLNAVFLCNSGTESVEGALKFAKCATGRPRVLSLKNSYHGLSYGALSVTGNPAFHEGFGPFVPGCETVAMGDLAELESQLKHNDVAAFIVELVQGKGVKFPKDDYFNRAQALCRKYGTASAARASGSPSSTGISSPTSSRWPRRSAAVTCRPARSSRGARFTRRFSRGSTAASSTRRRSVATTWLVRRLSPR